VTELRYGGKRSWQNLSCKWIGSSYFSSDDDI
jgi:hypothetical protein